MVKNLSDIDSIVEHIAHLDSGETQRTDVSETPEQRNVEDALAMLKMKQVIHDTQDASNRIRTLDAFANPAAKTGWGEENLINATEYPLTRLTQDWQLLTSLYRSSWIIQRVCNVIPEDALSDLSIEAPGISMDDMHKLEEEIRSTHLRESILEGLRWGRLYGGAAAIIMISNQEEDLSTPLDINNIMPGAFRGLYVVDRWSGIYPSAQLVDNERDPDFGLPEFYEVRDELGAGTCRVHHSRVLRFSGIEMPYWEQIAEQYWGTSVIEAMYDELVKRDNVAHNIANLTFKANLNVLKVENLDQMFASTSSIHQRRMYQMLSAINTIENSLGIRLINSTDDFQQFQYSFSGLPEVMDSAMMDMAGATCIPVTRLFGRSPAGMNSTGESDEKMYRQTLEQERAIHIAPILDRLIPIICRSAIGSFPAGASFKFPSLIELSMQEKVSVLDQTLQPIERLFQANLIPGDAVLEAFRNAQNSLDMTSAIKDEYIERVRGKYQNDLMQNADPYGGAMQSAGEAGSEEEQQVDEDGNPIEQQTDEDGNPIPPEQAQQEQAQEEGQTKALKAMYEGITKSAPAQASKDIVAQTAELQGISPEDLKKRLREEAVELAKRKRRKKAYQEILSQAPDEVAQSLVAGVGAEAKMEPEAFLQQIQAAQAKRDPKMARKLLLQQQQAAEQQQEQASESQRKDSIRLLRKRRKKQSWL